MPSSSEKQKQFMAAVAHNQSFAKKAGVPQSVGKEFAAADARSKGGARSRTEQQAVNKPKTNHGESALFAKGGYMASKIPPFMGKETKSEEAKEMKVKAKSPAMYMKGEKAEGVHGKSGKEKPTKYAKGGFVRSADGIASKGKTKGKMC
jgi:hypothetical protein